MCTAINFNAKDNYFGRTLDVEIEYKTSVVICPRNFALPNLKQHHAIIGMALVYKNYPLFFDGTNEFGLSMAGLNFPKNAYYFPEQSGKNNLAVYEFIPYILGKCKTVEEAKKELQNIVLTNKTFQNMPSTPLHYIICDKEISITVEQTITGLHIYENKFGVLTNNPTFPWHETNMINYINLTELEAENRFSKELPLENFCKGLGGVGLPGDLSSPSRFVRVAFSKFKAKKYEDEMQNVHQFFHILGSVQQITGLSRAGESYEQTLYTSCCNTTKGIYYYTTYFNSQIQAVDIHKVCLNENEMFVYPLKYEPSIIYQN